MEVVDDDLTYANVDSYSVMGPLKLFPTIPLHRFLMTKYEPMDF